MTRAETRPERRLDSAPPPAPPIIGRRRTIALVAVLTGLLLDLLDIVIVNVALPTIQDDIGASASHMQWTVGTYTLAFATMLVTGGRLGDIYGRRRIFIIGMVGFAAASLAAGLATAPEILIVARLVQGGFGALMVPQVLSILQVMYPPQERGKAFAALSVVFAVGTVAGPAVGALLTTADIAGLTWRTIFLVNLPITIACLVVVVRLVPESKSEGARRLDIPGAVLVGLGMLFLVLPLIQGPALGWPAWTVASLGAAVISFLVLLSAQRERTDSPLIPMSLFSHRSFRGGLTVSLFFMAGVMPFFLINTLYLQFGQGFSVMHAGLIGIIWGFAVPLFTHISARYVTPRLGRLGLQLGLVMLMASMALLIAVISAVPAMNALYLAPGLILGGAGMGMTFAPLLTYTLHDVPVESAGSASGVFNTVQQMGSTLGIALSSMVFFIILFGNTDPAVEDMNTRMRADIIALQMPAETTRIALANAEECFTERLQSADRTADVEGCRLLTEQAGPFRDAVAAAYDAAERLATRDAYQATTSRALIYQIVMFALAMMMSFLLPRRVG
jgi:EmrB/QacA subfamily drug resistance transporter